MGVDIMKINFNMQPQIFKKQKIVIGITLMVVFLILLYVGLPILIGSYTVFKYAPNPGSDIQNEIEKGRPLHELPIERKATDHSLKQVSHKSLIYAAMYSYRKKHDDLYPQSLGELVPDYLGNIPNDPQTNTPYEYYISDDRKHNAVCATTPTGYWCTEGSIEE